MANTPAPGDDRMQALWARYDGGDILGARKEARRLRTDATATEAERAGANELLARQTLPRAALLWGGLALVLIGFMVLLAWARGH